MVSNNHLCAFVSVFCSGWICYAEKTHGEFILPYISTTRSPQQMMGSLVKGYFAEQQVQETPAQLSRVPTSCY